MLRFLHDHQSLEVREVCARAPQMARDPVC
jgi:hypothetical protein